VFNSALAGSPVGGDPLGTGRIGTTLGAGTGPLNIVPFQGEGKYFVGVRGYLGPAEYTIVGLTA
jgi:hypothetical protein